MNLRPKMQPNFLYGPPISIVHGLGTINIDLISTVIKNVGEVGYTFTFRDGSYLHFSAEEYFIEKLRQKLAMKRAFVEGYCLVYVNGYFPGDEWYIPLREISHVHVDLVRNRIEVKNLTGERFNLYVDEVHKDWENIIRFHIEKDRKIRNNWERPRLMSSGDEKMVVDSVHEDSENSISVDKSDENMLGAN